MKKKVQIILLEDVPAIGRAGQVVAVAEGFARNSLFPYGKAALATVQTRAEQERAGRQQAEQNVQAAAAAQAKAEQLTGTELTMTARVKDGDDIFGTITKKDIARELNAQAGLTLKTQQVNLPQAIAKIGSYDVEVNLTPDNVAAIRVTVMAEPGTASASDEEK